MINLQANRIYHFYYTFLWSHQILKKQVHLKVELKVKLKMQQTKLFTHVYSTSACIKMNGRSSSRSLIKHVELNQHMS